MAKIERIGIRKRRDTFKKRIPDLGFYFIVTDTEETERNYLYGLRESLPKDLQGRIVITVSKAKTNKLVEACREQAAMEAQYAEPWIVFDRDEVVNFDQIIKKAYQNNINVAWSNPCIEIWFDCYFGVMNNCQNSVVCCSSFADTFKKKTGQRYIKSNKQIYQLLNQYGNEKRAIEIAKKRFKQYKNDNINKPSNMCPCTTVYNLIEEIKNKVERNL